MCATIPVCAGHGIKMCNKWHLHRTVLTVAYAAQVAYAAHRAALREGGTGVASYRIFFRGYFTYGIRFTRAKHYVR